MTDLDPRYPIDPRALRFLEYKYPGHKDHSLKQLAMISLIMEYLCSCGNVLSFSYFDYINTVGCP